MVDARAAGGFGLTVDLEHAVAAPPALPAASGAAQGRLWPLMAIAALLLALKLVLMAASGPFMDEAYYWLWGQHPALSYYDHPPLSAWLQALSAQLFGWSILSLRLWVVVLLIGDARPGHFDHVPNGIKHAGRVAVASLHGDREVSAGD